MPGTDAGEGTTGTDAGQFPTLGLALIVKNEAHQIGNLLESVEGAFDRVVLVDTGSRDKTKQVFTDWAEGQEGLSYEVADFKWVDDFSAPRAYADSLLDTTFHVWADADDVLRGAQNLRQMVGEAPPELSAFIASYDYAQDQFGNCICVLKRERVVRAGKGNWQGRVHEAQVVDGPVAEIPPDVCVWVHQKQPDPKPKAQNRNLRILRKWIKDEPKNPRVLAYLGTETMTLGKVKQAVPFFKRYLKLKNGWDEERAQVHRKLAMCQLALGKPEDAIKTAFEALRLLPHWTDSYLTLAEAHYSLGEYEKAVAWAEEALRRGQPESLLILNPLDYSVQPRVVLAGALGTLGRVEEAIEHAQTALQIVPDHPELRRGYVDWAAKSKREATARTYLAAAQGLVAHDEQLKALTLLEDCVPHFATDEGRIVALRSELRERVGHLLSPTGLVEHYREGGSKPEDMIADEKVDEVAGSLPRVAFLIRGLREQAGLA